MKKSLIFWFAAITCAALFLVGCESPTNGDAGAAGKNVGFINETNVEADDLAALFLEGDIVTLGPDVDTVEGVIPAGKKLAVSGETTVNHSGTGTLKIEAGGSVEVHKGAALFATYISGTAGGVIGAAGSVYGDGAVLLPYVTDNTWPNPDGYLIYNNSTAPNKAAGSVTDGTTQPTTVTATAVGTLLTTASQVTVYDLTGITAATIPAGKKLYLIGSGNTISAADFNLAAEGAELIVKEGAVLDAGTQKIEGNVTNNGTIESTATVAANQKALLTLNGTGTVKLGAEGAGAVDSAALALTQNVEIASSGKLIAPVQPVPFSGGKTITITGTGILDLGAAATTSFGATVKNNGTAAGAITTTTTDDKALGIIMGAGGKITASGLIAGLTQALTVPAGVKLTTDTSVTFATGNFPVTVEADAEATFTKGTFAAVNSPVTINGKAVFTEATFAALVGTAGTTILSVGEGANATFTAATFATGTVGDIVINGDAEFGAAAVPGGDVKVVGGGSLTVSSTGSLTIDAGKTLDIAADGVVALTDTGSVVLATASPTSVGKITGTGTLTAGATTITGAWEAVATGSSPGTLTIASLTSATASITADGTNATGLKASAAGATITQAAGEGNTLKIAAGTTITVATNGSIVLKKQTTGTDGGVIDLNTTSAKIAGLTGGTSNRTLIPANIANATYTVGSSTGQVTGGGTANAGNAYITGGNDTGPNPIKATDSGGSDVTINASTLVGANA